MGGKPIMALAILGMPIDKIPLEMVREILKGGASVCAAAGIPVAGGHSIDCPEPIYGLAVIGLCHPEQVLPQRRRQAGRRADPDQAARRRHLLGRDQEGARCRRPAYAGDDRDHHDRSTRSAPSSASTTACMRVTDVTGFGLLGHALEMARGSKLSVVIEADEVPLLADAAMLAQQGFVTGASHRNWASYGADVGRLPAGLPEWKRHLLTDPQTSGGLLVVVHAPPARRRSSSTIKAAGFPSASIIGRTEAGAPKITVI